MATPTKERFVRITILVYRREDITEDEFHHHWSHVHAPLVNKFLAEKGVIRYNQYHTPSSMQQQAISTLGLPEALVAKYDGFVEIVLPDLETFKAMTHDPFYLAEVAPDEAKMADQKKTQVIVGYEELYIQDGRSLLKLIAGFKRRRARR